MENEGSEGEMVVIANFFPFSPLISHFVVLIATEARWRERGHFKLSFFSLTFLLAISSPVMPCDLHS